MRLRCGPALRYTAIGVHREAEFAKSHTPAFMRGEEPRKYVSVYPYVRSLEWYLLPEEERSEMLREHGMMGRSRPEVRANTISSAIRNNSVPPAIGPKTKPALKAAPT